MDERQRYREVLAINRAIAGAEDYGEVLRLVVDRTAAFTGATACMLLLSQADGLARVVRSVGIDPAKAARLALPLTERIDRELCNLLGFKATDGFVGVPVIGKGGLMGILAVYREEPGAVDGVDDRLISAFADQAAIALDNAERVRRLGDEEALRRSEQRLRTLADSMPQLSWTAQPDGSITWYNRRWYEYTGTTPEQATGWGWQSVHDPARLPDVLRRWRESIAASTALDIEFPLRGANGKFRRFLTRVLPLKDSRGNVIQWLGTSTDVTELVEAQEALRESDRRKTEFLGMLSHELRNPLAPILSSLYVLDRAPAGSERSEHAKEVIQRQTVHLTRLIDDLLDVTRISRGKIELVRTQLDVQEILRRICDDHRTLFEGRGITVLVEESSAPVWVDADATRITQLLGNLLQNAAKFSHEGGTITASVGSAKGQAEIRVRDNGIGIAPDFLPRVFEQFVQAEGGLARPKGGLGLGLALVKGLVELHGGTVSARSEGLGRGSEFVVNLPLAPPPLQAAPALQPASLPAPTKRALEILVIDDNVDAAQGLAVVLEMEGHRVHVATDGLSGIMKARELKPEVVLCDIGLPDVDGYEIARTLRADEGLRSTRLIALSGYAQPEDRRRAQEAGFDAHLAKPPAMDLLLALVAQCDCPGGLAGTEVAPVAPGGP
jgi:PAS domain S-box-containing protein